MDPAPSTGRCQTRNHLVSLSLGFPIYKMGEQEHPPHQVREQGALTHKLRLLILILTDLMSCYSSIKQHDPHLDIPLLSCPGHHTPFLYMIQWGGSHHSYFKDGKAEVIRARGLPRVGAGLGLLLLT